MFAANMVSSGDSLRGYRRLNHVMFALEMKAEEQNCPEGFDKYLDGVFKRTVVLRKNPTKKGAIREAKPEEISLALRMTWDDELRQIVEKASEIGSISREQAKIALTKLEAFDDPYS